MKDRSKTRFAINVNGQDTELFSVLDCHEKGIVIFDGTPRFFEKPDGDRIKLVEYAEQHYSIHPSNKNDVTITQKTTLADGHEISVVSYVHDAKDHLLWPVYARRLPVYNLGNRKLVAGPNDKTINVGAYATAKATFLFSVFVTNGNSNIILKNDGVATKNIIRLEIFDLIVFCTFLNVPSLNEQDVVGWTTSSRVENGQRSDDHLQLQVKSIPISTIHDAHAFLMEQLKQRMMSRIEKMLQGHPQRAENLANVKQLVQKLYS